MSSWIIETEVIDSDHETLTVAVRLGRQPVFYQTVRRSHGPDQEGEAEAEVLAEFTRRLEHLIKMIPPQRGVSGDPALFEARNAKNITNVSTKLV